jgi:hypothetical protein
MALSCGGAGRLTLSQWHGKSTIRRTHAHRHLQRQRHQCSRLPALLQWLDETRPDVACLQELKAPQEKFPEAEIRAAGYIPIWHGQKSWNGVAILARGVEPVEVTRGLPGDPTDEQSRYIEAMVNGVRVVACLYLPNGNPAPGPKFDYKLAWFERHAAARPGVHRHRRAGGPRRRLQRDADRARRLQARSAGSTTPCSAPRRARLRAAGPGLDRRAAHPASRTKRSTPSGTTSAMPSAATPACASTTCCSALRWRRS